MAQSASVVPELITFRRFEAAPSPRPSPIGWERVSARTGEGFCLGSGAGIRFQAVVHFLRAVRRSGGNLAENFLPGVKGTRSCSVPLADELRTGYARTITNLGRARCPQRAALWFAASPRRARDRRALPNAERFLCTGM